MRNKKIIATTTVLLISLIMIIGVIIYEKKQDNNTFIEFSDYSIPTRINEDYKLFKDYNSLLEAFPRIKAKNYHFDFSKYNYYYFTVKYDYCSEANARPIKYEIIDDTIDITVKYDKACSSCKLQYDLYLVPIAKKYDAVKLNFSYEVGRSGNCHYNDVEKKPIIYLYPEEETKVKVSLSDPSKLLTTYPEYNNGWNVTAYKDGTLIDNSTNKEYYGLFWEGKDCNYKVTDEGFVIKGEDTASFLEDKLTILGLIPKEREEFIIFWLPILKQNKYNYIRFATEEEINNYMSLNIEPKPDSLIRVLMTYKPLNNKIKVKEQTLIPAIRKGFTAVEWGGTEIK